MRVNHTGEVCAQALYRGQSLLARSSDVRERLAQAAHEEEEHLAWTQERLSTLEHGKSGMPSVQSLARLASGLACSLLDLLQATGIDDQVLGTRPDRTRAAC